MQIDIIAIGNSRGIRIPAALLKECEFGKKVEVTVKNKQLVLKKAAARKNPAPKKKKLRAGWEAAAKRMAARGEDGILPDWDFPNEFDHTEWTTHPEWQ